MKILRIVSAGYEQGGVENGIILTNALLRRRGHEVMVISAEAPPNTVRYSDCEFRGIPSAGAKRIIHAAFNFDAYAVTHTVLHSFEPDVVLLHTMSQPTASVLFLLKNYPTALFVHGPEVFTKTLLPWYLSRKDYRHDTYDIRDLTAMGRLHYIHFRYLCGVFYKIGLRNVDRVVALSTYTNAILKREGFSPAYLKNGARIFAAEPLPEEPRLLYVGRLEKFKGVDYLIRAMPKILTNIPSATLHIVGTGTFETELKALVRELGLESSVIFYGHQHHEQLIDMYRRCAVCIMPSIWPETFGKVGIEAMSVGRPVLATDVGGVRDWLDDGKNGFLLKPADEESIAHTSLRLLSDRKLLERMSKEARKTAEGFSIESMAENIEALCKELTLSVKDNAMSDKMCIQDVLERS